MLAKRLIQKILFQSINKSNTITIVEYRKPIYKDGTYKTSLKVYSHKTIIFLKYILVLCSPVNLLKHNIFALFGRLKQYFSWFYCFILLCAILLSCGITRPVIQAGTGVDWSPRQGTSLRQVSLLPPE